MLRVISTFFLIGCATTLHGQEIRSWVKVGAHAGIPATNNAGDVHFMLGVEAKYQIFRFNNLSGGVASGYSHYFGQSINYEERYGLTQDFGILPLAGMVRFSPLENFYIGGDMGYAFGIGRGEGGLYYRPEVGWQNPEWNVFVFMQNVHQPNGHFSAFGMGIMYNVIRSVESTSPLEPMPPPPSIAD